MYRFSLEIESEPPRPCTAVLSQSSQAATSATRPPILNKSRVTKLLHAEKRRAQRMMLRYILNLINV